MPRNRIRYTVYPAMVLIAACAAPPAAPLEDGAVVASVHARAVEVTPEEALTREELEPFGLGDLAPPAGGVGDPTRDDYWHACVLAWNPDVRRARRAFRAAREAARDAGTPGPIGANVTTPDFENADERTNAAFTVDVIGLLGLEPAAAEAALAEARVGRRLGDLERVVRDALLEADLARIRLAAARVRAARLEAHLDEVRVGLRRLEILAERGRVGSGILGRSRAVVAGLSSDVKTAVAAVVRARESLARAAGLSPDAPALDAVSPSALDAPQDSAMELPPARALLERLPELRADRLAYAEAEARVRSVAAQTWPDVRIGPRIEISPDRVLPGGVLSIGIPFPGSFEGRIHAALEEREAAREALEDDLAAALNAVTSNLRESRIDQDILRTEAPERERKSALAWRAARAMLSVGEGLEVIEPWLDALELRAAGVLAVVNAAGHAAETLAAFRRSAGEPPGLERRTR